MHRLEKRFRFLRDPCLVIKPTPQRRRLVPVIFGGRNTAGDIVQFLRLEPVVRRREVGEGRGLDPVAPVERRDVAAVSLFQPAQIALPSLLVEARFDTRIEHRVHRQTGPVSVEADMLFTVELHQAGDMLEHRGLRFLRPIFVGVERFAVRPDRLLAAHRRHIAQIGKAVVAVEVDRKKRVAHSQGMGLLHHELLHADILAGGFSPVAVEEILPRLAVKVDGIKAHASYVLHRRRHAGAVREPWLEKVSEPKLDERNAGANLKRVVHD